MRRLILLLVVLGAAIWAGVQIRFDPGYVLITINKWSIETTVWFALLAMVVVFFILYFLVRLVSTTTQLGHYLQRWKRKYTRNKVYSLTNLGLSQFAEGQFAAAEKSLIKSAQNSQTPLINYLTAARAAQEQAAYERRDQYFQQAHREAPEMNVAIGLSQVELQIKSGQLEQALASLTHLHQLRPKHPMILRMLKDVYVALQDWQKLQALLSSLQKYNVMDKDRFSELEQRVHLALLNTAAKHNDLEKIELVWQQLPRHLKYVTPLVLCYCHQLINHQASDRAETWLHDSIKKNWDQDLVDLYGHVKGDKPAKQLSWAESWHRHHPKDPVLLRCLGRLAVRNQLWGKAKSYFEAGLAIQEDAETYRELATLLEQVDEHRAALETYRKGLLVA